MKLSGRKIILLVILGGLLAGGLGVAIYYWQAKRAVTVYRQQLIAAGEKLTVKELIPPPPSKEDDGAELFHRVRSLMNSSSDLLSTNPPLSMQAVAPGKAAVGWLQPNLHEDKATNTWDDLADAIERMTAELALLDQLADKQTMDFKFSYNQGFAGLLPMLAPMKQASQRLRAAVVFALYEDDAEAATAHVRGMLGLVRGLTDERLIISQLVRIAIAHITQAATWEFLQSTNTTDAQLETIQRDWAALDFVLPAEHSLEMERAISEMTIGDMRESRAGFNRVTSGYGFFGAGGGGANWSGSGDVILEATQFAKDTWTKTKDASKEVAWRVAWSHSDQLRMLKGTQIQIETLRAMQTNQSFSTALSALRTRMADIGVLKTANDDSDWTLLVDGSGLQTMFSSSIPALSKMLHKVMTIEAGKQLTVTAIALKRYKLHHGNLPADLAALVPEFLPAVPLDPVNAQPLHYKPNADGTFLLYSVGEDAEDNGGDPTPPDIKTKSNSWQRGRDWVWPQPASAQEIEDHFQQKRRK